MFNQKNLLAQFKKDAKTFLAVRCMGENVYITNRRYVTVFPETMLAAMPKINTFLFDTFGEKWFEWKKNAQIQSGRTQECTLDLTRIIPQDTKPGQITGLIWENGGMSYRIAKNPDKQLVFIDNNYAVLLDSPATQARFTDHTQSLVVVTNDVCTFLVLPIRVPDDKQGALRAEMAL